MKTAFKIFLFTILVSAFYAYVGQTVPQKETYPPEETVIGADLTVDEMVEIGEEIVGGKGTCLTCHTIGGDAGGRFPDLGGIGLVAGSRVEGSSAERYLAESMYDPNKFVVEGFLPGMPAIDKPPISLTDDEILTVIAYLQTLGSTPTVTMDSEFEWQGQSPAPLTAASSGAGAATPGVGLSGEEIFGAFLCTTCHSVDSPTPLVGPSLFDAGSRMTRAEIYEAIVDPDATIAEGYTGGIMSATLAGTGFHDKLSAQDVRALVEYIYAMKGD